MISRLWRGAAQFGLRWNTVRCLAVLAISVIAWIAVAVFGFYTAYTVFEVPHMSLGAELSFDVVVTTLTGQSISVTESENYVGIVVAFQRVGASAAQTRSNARRGRSGIAAFACSKY